jgi:hypothetical protein
VFRVSWIALTVLIAGCATITRGTMQSVSVNTPNVTGVSAAREARSRRFRGRDAEDCVPARR